MFLFEELSLVFAVAGHGKAQFAVHTQHLIEQKAHTDVVVGTCTIEHDYNLRFVQRPLPPGVAVYFGRIASGDEDVITPERVLEVRNATGALASVRLTLGRVMPNLARLLFRWCIVRGHSATDGPRRLERA